MRDTVAEGGILCEDKVANLQPVALHLLANRLIIPHVGKLRVVNCK